MKVIFFQRKRRKGNFSVEILFDEIRRNLPKSIQPVICIAFYESNGFFKRLYICLEAAFRQRRGQINHVTGDINFLPIFLRKKRTVTTILDVGFMNHPNRLARHILQFFWIKVPVWRSSVITTISQATKDELLKYVTCDPEKVKVVYVPVSPNFRRSDRPFNSAKPSILQIGTKPNKNVPRLIEALKDVPCTLDIVGELTEEMIRALESYKISYINSSRIPENELISKYENCDIVSFVSTYEGFGMPIVEANIVGKPVITSNILSMPEIAGNAAHLVDPLNIDEIREGFRKLIGDWAYRNELVMNGYENHQRFSAVRIAKQLEEIYTDLLN